MIRMRAVEKRYGGFQALHPLDLDVHNGEVFGYVVDKPSDIPFLNLAAVDFHAGPLAEGANVERMSVFMVLVEKDLSGRPPGKARRVGVGAALASRLWWQSRGCRSFAL